MRDVGAFGRLHPPTHFLGQSLMGGGSFAAAGTRLCDKTNNIPVELHQHSNKPWTISAIRFCFVGLQTCTVTAYNCAVYKYTYSYVTYL